MREHPVTAYARSVVDGQVVAGRLVRLACERHLRDLDELPARGYLFSGVHADHALTFFPRYLRLYDAGDRTGDAFQLEPWQQFIVGSLFGWLGPDGFRRFRTAYIEAGKGNGKTPLLAGIGLYGLMCDEEPGAQILCAAVTREQAHALFDDARSMAEESPALEAELVIGLHNIAHPASKSYIRTVSSEGRSLDAKRVHMALIDEIHEHQTDAVVVKLRLGLKGRRQGLVVEITNSGYDRKSVCWQHHEQSRRIVEAVEQNEAWFAYVCGLDPCEDCRSVKHYDMPQESCRDCDDWRDARVWLKANPNLGVSIDRDYLEKAVDEAQQILSTQNYVKRLNFCIWTENMTRWLPADLWARGGVQPLDLAALKKRPCVAGLDLSRTDDLTALDLIFPDEDFFADVKSEPESEKPELEVAGGVSILAYFWCPEDSIIERTRQGIPYQLWRDQGLIEPTPGNSIDYRAIRRRIKGLRDAGFNIREIAYDPAFAQQLATQLQDEDGFVVTPIAQTFAMLNEPLMLTEILARRGAIRHGGNALLAWNVANAVVITDGGGRRVLSKGKSPEKIDGAAALVTGMKRLFVIRQARSVYETRGVIAL